MTCRQRCKRQEAFRQGKTRPFKVKDTPGAQPPSCPVLGWRIRKETGSPQISWLPDQCMLASPPKLQGRGSRELRWGLRLGPPTSALGTSAGTQPLLPPNAGAATPHSPGWRQTAPPSPHSAQSSLRTAQPFTHSLNTQNSPDPLYIFFCLTTKSSYLYPLVVQS